MPVELSSVGSAVFPTLGEAAGSRLKQEGVVGRTIARAMGIQGAEGPGPGARNPNTFEMTKVRHGVIY